MAYCLIPKLATEMLNALRSGKINPESLAKMASEERRVFFEKLLKSADDAKNINALFESKLLLKNQKAGMITWAKTITGIKEPVKRDIITKIERLDKVLDPKSEKVFLEDLASKRLGIDITFEEAKVINDLANDFQKAKEAVANGENPSSVNYGAKKVSLLNYTNLLKVEAGKMEFGEYLKEPWKIAEFIGGNLKSIKASVDNSALFRQGWRALFTNPVIWANNAGKSFIYLGKTLKGDANVLDAIKAEIYNRKNSINDYYRKSKLDIGTGEEAYPTSLPERIPLFGRLFKASQVTYEGFLMRLRADIFDKLVKMQENQQGAKLSDFDLQSLGNLVNSLTGRGGLGSFEKVGKEINTVFFSPKFLKSNVDFLTLHAGQSMSAFARRQAALNLVKVVGGITVALAIAKILKPDSVETDARSSDFGKIRIGNTRFDMTGGMTSLAVLAMRIIRQSSKSSTTGIISKFGEGYGSMNAEDIIANFVQNKFSPLFSLVKDLITQKDFLGNKPTITGEVGNVITPMSIANAYELLKNPNAANFVLAAIADGLGIATNTYGYQANWESNTSKELQAFKKKVGDKKFKEANQEYNNLVDDYILKVKKDPKFIALTEDKKQTHLTSVRAKIKSRIISKYLRQ